ncbi:MAG: SPOR domain-containing protein [Proteobacteria bacterium]|nr:SPOR domain-containing protein [Pseudomonadota bacterium]
MANESSLRSYRDFDAYNRDAHAADLEPRRTGGDPLAELARIMGQDQGYADLLKSVARTRDDLPAADGQRYADEADEGELDIPAMNLRGAEVPATAEIDWDDLEAELETYQRTEHAPEADMHASDEDASDELRGSYRDWDGRDATTADLERLLADEFRDSGEQAPAEQGRSRLGFGAAALGAVAAGGAAALAWKARSGRQASAGEIAPQAQGTSHQASDGGYAAADGYAAYDSAYAEHDAPPRRRRAGMTAIAAVLGLAVLGGGAVYGYRAVTGGGSAGGEPRIVRANPEPVRVAVQQDPKPVTDRVPGGERIVSREERPVSQREQAAQVQVPPAPSRVIPLVPAPAAAPIGMVTDPGQAPVRTVNAVPVPAPSGAPTYASSSVATQPAAAPVPTPRAGEEPRRVRTVQVGPDGSILQPAAAPQPRSAPAASAQPLSVVPGAPALAAAETRSTPAPAARPVQTVRVARAEPVQEPVRPVAAPRTTGSATPVDLGPQRTATVRPAATASGSTFVQISSHQSDSEARSAFTSAQRRYPMLQGQSANIRTAEIAGRGTWHRLRVGPFSREEAQSFCQRLKSAGGSCVLN